MKEVVVKYDSQENGCDFFDLRDNGGVIGFDEESVNSVSLSLIPVTVTR